MNIRKLLTRLVSLALIAVFLPTVAMADTWYLEDGSITVSATDSGQNVSQGGVTKEDSAPVIRNRDSSASTTNNVTIRADTGATANVTLEDTNIDTTGGAGPNGAGDAAVRTEGAGNVNLNVELDNTLQSGNTRASVEKGNGGNLTIGSESGSGQLVATGGSSGAGIGGGENTGAENITITGGDIFAIVQYVSLVSAGVVTGAFAIISFPQAEVAAKRIGQVLHAEGMADPIERQDIKLSGDIDFDHVTFRYEGAAEAALKDITLSVKKGQRAAIIGGPGSGKSTLVQLLLGFRMPTSGEVRMDGMPTQTLSRRTMRDNISCVLQNATIYSGTIRDNVRMGRLEAGDVEIREALEIAQAGEFVNGFSDGIDHMIRQSGKNLSGGQKQRLSIARALLKNAPIYIFDDSFSALDFLTEAKLRAPLNRNLAGKTQLIITQRVTSAMHCDVIFVMDGGALVDSGTHAQLLERCGVYREIYASQTGGNLNA